MIKSSNLAVGIKNNFLFFAVIVFFFALLFRNSGLYPTVFHDEYLYSKFSRLLPLADSTLPGYIYLAIYRFTNICGDGFLDCARILNVLFFVAAAPFIYLTAKQVCPRSVASIVALLALLGPINSYTAYYMPESLYFFSFWLFTWFILRLDNTSDLRSWCIAGMLLGLSALVKPHALFLLPGIVIYILYISRKKEGTWLSLAFLNGVIFIAITFFTKFLIGYLLAGKAGLVIFGHLYTSIASSTTSNFQHYIELLALSGENIKGHVLAISLMFGLPIASAIYALLRAVFSELEIKINQKISFYALVVLVNLIIAVGLFTATMVIYGQHNTDTSLHMRYYNFALPLLLVVAASQLYRKSTNTMRKWRMVVALPIGTTILFAVYSQLIPYTPNFVECPELYGFTLNSKVFYVLSGISFLSLALWVYADRMGAKVFVYFFMPLMVGLSTFYVNQTLRQRLAPNVLDKAGIFTRNYLSNEELSKLVVVGSDRGGLSRTLFYLDNPRIPLEALVSGSAYDVSKLPDGKEWILIVGNHSLSENVFFKLPMQGFTLARMIPARTTGKSTVDFKESEWPRIISNVQGLSSAEPWGGAWSTSDTVALEFSVPLPEKFTIHLVAKAFGPNVGKEFVAHVGDSAKSFTLSTSREERVLEFDNPKKSKIIKIKIPSPISPKELGLSGDERRLGIGLFELKISP